MKVFVDTSAFLSVLSADDKNHLIAKENWEKLIFSRTSLFCSNYILVETLALVQRRLGMNAVKIFKDDVLPIIEIIWINENIHNEGMNLFISENKRKLSFVDCISFVTMKHYGINIAFTFDSHFFKEGFNCIP